MSRYGWPCRRRILDHGAPRLEPTAGLGDGGACFLSDGIVDFGIELPFAVHVGHFVEA